jgi:predicted DNA-binding protein
MTKLDKILNDLQCVHSSQTKETWCRECIEYILQEMGVPDGGQ